MRSGALGRQLDRPRAASSRRNHPPPRTPSPFRLRNTGSGLADSSRRRRSCPKRPAVSSARANVSPTGLRQCDVKGALWRRLFLLVESDCAREMIQQLGWDRLPAQDTSRDCGCHGHREMRGVVAHPEISRRPLVESVDHLAELSTLQLSPLPSLEGLCNRNEGSPELLFVSRCRILTQEAFDAFRHVSHTSSSLARIRPVAEFLTHYRVGPAEGSRPPPFTLPYRSLKPLPSSASFASSAAGFQTSPCTRCHSSIRSRMTLRPTVSAQCIGPPR